MKLSASLLRTRPSCQIPAISGSTPAGRCDPGRDDPCSRSGSHFVLSRSAARGVLTMRFRRLVALHEDVAVALIVFAAAYVGLVLLGAAMQAGLFGDWL